MSANLLDRTSSVALCPLIASAQAALDAVNRARAVGRDCGDTFYRPAAPLAWSDQLAAAALAHSQDMATRNFYDHTNPDGITGVERIRRAGYRGHIGENIAAHHNLLDSVMGAWIDSPNHCATIMNPKFTYVATACAVPKPTEAAYSSYWTQDFGSK